MKVERNLQKMEQIIKANESNKFFMAIAVKEAIVLSGRYANSLQIRPSEAYRYFKKSINLAACYAGFAQELSKPQAVGAGKAAFFSCAYDVVSDWKKPPAVHLAYEKIMHKEAPKKLEEMSAGLLDRDIKGLLKYDGLERGVVATYFVLEMMGLRDKYEQKTDVDKLGITLQIVDDVLDYEGDVKVGDVNCLTSVNRNKYLTQLLEVFREENMHELFPYAGILGIAVKKSRNKAADMLSH